MTKSQKLSLTRNSLSITRILDVSLMLLTPSILTKFSRLILTISVIGMVLKELTMPRKILLLPMWMHLLMLDLALICLLATKKQLKTGFLKIKKMVKLQQLQVLVCFYFGTLMKASHRLINTWSVVSMILWQAPSWLLVLSTVVSQMSVTQYKQFFLTSLKPVKKNNLRSVLLWVSLSLMQLLQGLTS